ncbi:MAG: hypothetical protein GX589_02665 [Deltaproteobacteria bacterium]|nr:hypothetical protein [Deltaproteobacteria bacterium]
MRSGLAGASVLRDGWGVDWASKLGGSRGGGKELVASWPGGDRKGEGKNAGLFYFYFLWRK